MDLQSKNQSEKGIEYSLEQPAASKNSIDPESAILNTSSAILYSLSITTIMDYLPKSDLLRLQCLCKYMHTSITPNYFGNRQFRANVLG